ncbi:MAG: PQQ-binding-like beta-propeller repeat protein [Pirellulaceae bacterium]
MKIASLVLCVSFFFVASAKAQHAFITQGNNRLVEINKDGEVCWEVEWGGIHDIHLLDSGNVMVQRGSHEIVEIDRTTKEVVWQYDSSKQNNPDGIRVEVHAFQPLADGSVMIAESGLGRIIEVNRDGEIKKTIPLKLDSPDAHRDTRLVRKLSNDNYLVCHEGDGAVREYSSDGECVWEFNIPLFGMEPKNGHGPESFGNQVFGAVRLPDGDTLIATGNGHSVLKVDPDQEIVWSLKQNELPGITLAWVTTLEVLSNGNYVIGNCHAGPGNPILIEMNPATKDVVWQFDGYEQLGNNVSNSILLDQNESRIR